MYLAVEGIDTAGKSTQIALLRDSFPDALITKEPGATPIGTAIRELVLKGEAHDPKSEFFLFLADRAEHASQVLAPNRDRLIISDRSLVSGIAYALTKGGIALETLVAYNRFATNGLLPDTVYLLQLTPQELHHRLCQKKLDGIEARGEAYLMQIQANMITAAQALGCNLVLIDATKPPEAVFAQIRADLNSRL
ncbi:MAG: dTMP kinase [Campylobacterales bacterium]|nr:dTMP kinase [Campylobacterales bacterium]